MKNKKLNKNNVYTYIQSTDKEMKNERKICQKIMQIFNIDK